MVRNSRRQEILDAALECFNEHGVEASTIDMIRERSGASVGSVYHHFGSKENIAIALHEAALAHHYDCVAELLADGSDAESTVKAMVVGYLASVTRQPGLARFLMQSRGFMVRTATDAVLESAARDKLSKSLRAWLNPHLRSGALRHLPAEAYVPLIMGPVQEYVWSWLSGRSQASPMKLEGIFKEAAWAAVQAG